MEYQNQWQGNYSHFEFGLTKPSAIGQVTRRVWDRLKLSLSVDITLDPWLQAGIAGNECIDQGLECEGGVPCPSIKVYT